MPTFGYGMGPTISAPGVSENMFDAMSKALFGSENVGAKWQSDVYPLPATMDKLVLPGATDYDMIANPSLLDNVSTQRRIKLFEFGLWAERMVGQGKHASLGDVIKEELAALPDFRWGSMASQRDWKMKFANLCLRMTLPCSLEIF